MFHNWFDQINGFLFAHPHWLHHLAFLFRLKIGLLTVLVFYFLYLIYKDKGLSKPVKTAKPENHPWRFIA
jgi:hypothetical protein